MIPKPLIAQKKPPINGETLKCLGLEMMRTVTNKDITEKDGLIIEEVIKERTPCVLTKLNHLSK